MSSDDSAGSINNVDVYESVMKCTEDSSEAGNICTQILLPHHNILPKQYSNVLGALAKHRTYTSACSKILYMYLFALNSYMYIYK